MKGDRESTFKNSSLKSGEMMVSQEAGGVAATVTSRGLSAFFSENVARISSALKKDFSASRGPAVDKKYRLGVFPQRAF